MTTDADLGGDPPCWSHIFDQAETDSPSEHGNGSIVADLGSSGLGSVAPGSSGLGSSGAIWSLPHGGDLDANLVRLDPSASIGSHVNNEVDVLIFVQSGSGALTVDGQDRPLEGDHLALIAKGSERSIAAGESGITYLSVHRRRSPLAINRRETNHG